MSDLTKVVQKLTETNKRLETLERQNAESGTPIERLKDALPEILAERREGEKQRKQDKEIATASDEAEAGRDKVAGEQFDEAQEPRSKVPGIIETTSLRSDLITAKQGDLIAENTKLQNMQLEAIRDPDNEQVKIQIQMQKEALGRVEDSITSLQESMTEDAENQLDAMPSLAVQEEKANEESQRRKEELASAFTPLKDGLGKIGEFFSGLKDRAKGGALTFLKAFGIAAGLGLLIEVLESDALKNLLSEENLKRIADGIKNMGNFFDGVLNYFTGEGENKLTPKLLDVVAIGAAITGIYSGIKLLRGFLFPTAAQLEDANRKAKLSGLLKFTLVATAIGALASGISEGFKEYEKSGDMAKAISAGLVGVIDFLTFGLIPQETLNNLKTYFSESIIRPVIKFLDEAGFSGFGAEMKKVKRLRADVERAQLNVTNQEKRKAEFEKQIAILEGSDAEEDVKQLFTLRAYVKDAEIKIKGRAKVLELAQKELAKFETPEFLKQEELRNRLETTKNEALTKRLQTSSTAVALATAAAGDTRSGFLRTSDLTNMPTGMMGSNINIVNNKGGDTTTVNKTISDVFVGNPAIAERMLGSQ